MTEPRGGSKGPCRLTELTMATIFALLSLITLGVGGLLAWAEVQAHSGPHSAFGVAGGLLLVWLGGLAAWRLGQGRVCEGIRWTCVAVSAALALLAVGQWPGIREVRFREATLTAEMRLEAARGVDAGPSWLSELERDVAVWTARWRHERGAMLGSCGSPAGGGWVEGMRKAAYPPV
jgi:hypothetical protein